MRCGVGMLAANCLDENLALTRNHQFAFTFKFSVYSVRETVIYIHPTDELLKSYNTIPCARFHRYLVSYHLRRSSSAFITRLMRCPRGSCIYMPALLLDIYIRQRVHSSINPGPTPSLPSHALSCAGMLNQQCRILGSIKRGRFE